MNFSERLKALRKEFNLTQEALAEKLNITKANVSKYETERVEPNIESLKFLAEFFDVSTDYLLGRTDERKSSAPAKPELSKKDKQDIDEYLKDLENSVEGLMFDGQPISDEDKHLLLEQIERTAELIKLRNKEKYTPKKYRKK